MEDTEARISQSQAMQPACTVHRWWTGLLTGINSWAKSSEKWPNAILSDCRFSRRYSWDTKAECLEGGTTVFVFSKYCTMEIHVCVVCLIVSALISHINRLIVCAHYSSLSLSLSTLYFFLVQHRSEFGKRCHCGVFQSISTVNPEGKHRINSRGTDD